MMKPILAHHEEALLHDDNFELQHTDDYIDLIDITDFDIGTRSRFMLVRHIGLLSRSANAIGNNDILANEIGSDDILSNTEDVNDARDNNDNVDDQHWHFREILSHEEVNRHSPSYQGSNFNVRVLWDNGEITDEPLQLFGRDAPVECAAYAQENNLLDTQEWKRFRRLARRYHLLNERSALRLPQILCFALKSTLPFLEALFLSLTFMDFLCSYLICYTLQEALHLMLLFQ